MKKSELIKLIKEVVESQESSQYKKLKEFFIDLLDAFDLLVKEASGAITIDIMSGRKDKVVVNSQRLRELSSMPIMDAIDIVYKKHKNNIIKQSTSQGYIFTVKNK